MGYDMRSFADGSSRSRRSAPDLGGIDPSCKIDGGGLTCGTELLGEVEINAPGSDRFAEDLRMKIGELERVASAAARQVIDRLRQTTSIVTLHVIDGERDPGVTSDLLGPLWSVLPGLPTGLTQSDGQAFYGGSQLVVGMA